MSAYVISAHQPNYLPYTGYFKKISMADQFIIITKKKINHKSWQNRNRLLNQKKIDWLTVPILIKNTVNENLYNIRINQDLNWQNKHYKSIWYNYHRYPFFFEIEEFLNQLYNKKKWRWLWELDWEIIKNLAHLLHIKTPIITDENIEWSTSKTHFLVEITKHFGGNTYLSSPNALQYIDSNVFSSNQIFHLYMIYRNDLMKNSENNEPKNLSIIDRLCRYGIDATYKHIYQEHYYFQQIDQLWEVAH